jgi:hypothetical protein
MQIMAGLKPGGEFHYAPGLPFFERHLAAMASYSIRRTPIPVGGQPGLDDILYVARVKKKQS